VTLAPAEHAEARALLVLGRLTGVGPARIAGLSGRFGSAVASLRASSGSFAAHAGHSAARERSSPDLLREVDSALERCERLGIGLTTWSSPGYPSSLRHLADPPPVLFLRGNVALLGGESVTVVGARRVTAASRDVAERLGGALGGAGVTVVSGLALGVDGAAHRGALEARGSTFAVLGTGADVAYPRSHRRLFRRILDEGLVVTEFLPGTPALPHHFPRRNRILAALSSATVVVEAGARSGSLITVDHALDLGRDVWVVPGPIERSPHAGSNRLLLEGARPLLSISDFVEHVAPGRGAAVTADVVSRPEARVLGALAGDTLEAGALASRLGVEVREVLALLTAMEVGGSVKRVAGMRFRRVA
jgi:DNA processing protein